MTGGKATWTALIAIILSAVGMASGVASAIFYLNSDGKALEVKVEHNDEMVVHWHTLQEERINRLQDKLEQLQLEIARLHR